MFVYYRCLYACIGTTLLLALLTHSVSSSEADFLNLLNVNVLLSLTYIYLLVIPFSSLSFNFMFFSIFSFREQYNEAKNRERRKATKLTYIHISLFICRSRRNTCAYILVRPRKKTRSKTKRIELWKKRVTK